MTRLSDLRAREYADDLAASAVRALAEAPDLELHHGRLLRSGAGVPHRSIHLDDTEDFLLARGVADAWALRYRYSDADLHGLGRPEGHLPGAVFDLLEQLRCESQVPHRLIGVRHNLRRQFAGWTENVLGAGLTETQSGLLVFTLAQIVHSRLTGEALGEQAEHAVEATRFWMAPRIGTDLSRLVRLRADQAAYAVPARSLALRLGDWAEAAAKADGSSGGPDRIRIPLLTDAEDDPTTDLGTGRTGGVRGAGAPSYRIFSSAHDRVEAVPTVLRTARQRALRQLLDDRLAAGPPPLTGAAARLRAAFASPTSDGWEFGQEEGVLDGRRLARLVSAPHDHRVFTRPKAEPQADLALTVLLDCSGSMKRHREPVAALADSLARAVELAGGEAEVLGFTTRSWGGGRPARAWRRTGSAEPPGRLAELRHLILKDADTTWRRSRAGLAGILAEELYKEGVDGEAVAWATGRLAVRDVHHRVLVVISDGSPMERATALANDDAYLARDLHRRVRRAESDAGVRVIGLGVGLDLGGTFRERLTLDVDTGSDRERFGEVIRLLAHGRRARRAP